MYLAPQVVFDTLFRPYIWRPDDPELLLLDNPFLPNGVDVATDGCKSQDDGNIFTP